MFATLLEEIALFGTLTMDEVKLEMAEEAAAAAAGDFLMVATMSATHY